MNSDTLYIRKKNHAFLDVNAEPSILNELTDFFAFRPEGYQFMPTYRNKMWDGFLRLFNSRTRELPIGLFDYLSEFCIPRNYKLEVDHDNYYGIPNSSVANVNMDYVRGLDTTSKGTKISHHDYQEAAVEYCLTKKNALILSPTASGKSLIIYSIVRYYMEHERGDVLIVVPSTSLIKQMFFDFGDYSEYDDTFDNTESCHLIYSGQEKNHNKRITISTWQSCYKMPQPWFKRFGCVIVDEAHTATAKSLSAIMGKLKDADYRFGTTGTIKDVKCNKLQLEGHFGKAFNVTTTKELMDKGTLSDLDISVLLLKYNDEACRLVSKMKYQDEVDWIVRNEKRNNFITNLSLDQDGNTLVLFQFVEKHGKPLYEQIKAKAHARRKIFYVSGETDANTREEIRQITESQKNAIIVASLGVFSTGINIRNLHNIVFASPSKSQIKILQSIGRGLRKSDDGRTTKLYDIADDLHWKSKKNYTLTHGAERIKIYATQKFNYKIYEVAINE